MKVKLNWSEEFYGMSLWIIEDMPNQRLVAKPVELVFEPLEIGLLPDPTLKFSSSKGTEFLSSLADALAASGIIANSLKTNEQQIEAIKYHLEDMRRLIFKPMVIKGE